MADDPYDIPAPREFTIGVAANSQANFYRTLEDDDGAHGVFVPTWHELPLGESVCVHVELPGDERFTAQGRIEFARGTMRETTWPGLGIRFVELGERERSIVQRFTAHRPPMLFDG